MCGEVFYRKRVPPGAGGRLLPFTHQGRGRSTVERQKERKRETSAAPIIVAPPGLSSPSSSSASRLVPPCGLRSGEHGDVLAVVRHAPTICLLCHRTQPGARHCSMCQGTSCRLPPHAVVQSPCGTGHGGPIIWSSILPLPDRWLGEAKPPPLVRQGGASIIGRARWTPSVGDKLLGVDGHYFPF